MATINLKKIGALVKVTITDDPPGTERIVYEDRHNIKFKDPDEDPVTGDTWIIIGDQIVRLAVVTNISFDGVAATDIADFEAKLPTVFPEANSGNGGPGSQTLQQTLDEGNTANVDVEITDFTKGVILKSPNATRWRITINNSGALVTTQI